MNAVVSRTMAAGLPSRLPDDVIKSFLIYRGHRRDVVLDGTSKTPHEVWPRHELAYLLSRLTRLSNARIGLLFGGRDHTTILNSIGRVTLRCEHDRVYARDVKALEPFALEFVPGNAEAVCQMVARALRGMASPVEVSALAVTITSVSSGRRAPDTHGSWLAKNVVAFPGCPSCCGKTVELLSDPCKSLRMQISRRSRSFSRANARS